MIVRFPFFNYCSQDPALFFPQLTTGTRSSFSWTPVTFLFLERTLRVCACPSFSLIRQPTAQTIFPCAACSFSLSFPGFHLNILSSYRLQRKDPLFYSLLISCTISAYENMSKFPPSFLLYIYDFVFPLIIYSKVVYLILYQCVNKLFCPSFLNNVKLYFSSLAQLAPLFLFQFYINLRKIIPPFLLAVSEGIAR